jgi:hypothetical protein
MQYFTWCNLQPGTNVRVNSTHWGEKKWMEKRPVETSIYNCKVICILIMALHAAGKTDLMKWSFFGDNNSEKCLNLLFA